MVVAVHSGTGELVGRIAADGGCRRPTAAEREAFAGHGLAVIDDVAPPEVARSLAETFSRATWDQVHDQVRESHYQHVFKMDSPSLPGPDEAYRAHFRRSTGLESGTAVPRFFSAAIQPLLEDLLNARITDFDIRCIGMTAGDFQRAHIDAYAGEIGFIYYLCREWVWDWGGLLNVIVDGQPTTILPSFNRLVALNHGKRRHPHFVSPVAPYAREDRLTIVGFCKT